MLTTNSLSGDYNSIHSGNSVAADQRDPGSFSNLKYVLTNWMMPCVSLLPSLIYSTLNYSSFRATQQLHAHSGPWNLALLRRARLLLFGCWASYPYMVHYCHRPAEVRLSVSS